MCRQLGAYSHPVREVASPKEPLRAQRPQKWAVRDARCAGGNGIMRWGAPGPPGLSFAPYEATAITICKKRASTTVSLDCQYLRTLVFNTSSHWTGDEYRKFNKHILE